VLHKGIPEHLHFLISMGTAAVHHFPRPNLKMPESPYLSAMWWLSPCNWVVENALQHFRVKLQPVVIPLASMQLS